MQCYTSRVSIVATNRDLVSHYSGWLVLQGASVASYRWLQSKGDNSDHSDDLVDMQPNRTLANALCSCSSFDLFFVGFLIKLRDRIQNCNIIY